MRGDFTDNLYINIAAWYQVCRFQSYKMFSLMGKEHYGLTLLAFSCNFGLFQHTRLTEVLSRETKDAKRIKRI